MSAPELAGGTTTRADEYGAKNGMVFESSIFTKQERKSMIRLNSLTTLGLLVSLGTTAHESLAQTVPYKASGTGASYNPVTGYYSGTGKATHLGNITFSGDVTTAPTTDPLVFTFQSNGPTTTVGANGDAILFTTSGTVQLFTLDGITFTAVWSGTFVVVGGTGRFANVGPGPEPLQVVAINDPFTLTDPEWTFSWSIDGSITLH
jgi:hypothetical protein